MDTFIEKHEVILSSCIMRNSSVGRVIAGQNTSNYREQHNPAIKGERTKQKQAQGRIVVFQG